MSNEVSISTWDQDIERLFVSVIDEYSKETGINLYETRSREGIFAPALIMWLMISGSARGRKSLSEALVRLSEGDGGLIRSKNKRSKKIKFSQHTGGLCRARERLPEEVVREITSYLSEYLIHKSCEKYRWHGRMVVLVDGTTITLSHTEEIIEKYPVIKNQNRAAHHPNLLCLCAVELFTGIALTPQYGPYRGEKATSELKLYKQMVEELPEQSLIIADRYFGNFSVAREANLHGHQVLVRLTDKQAHAIVKWDNKDYVKEVTWCPTKSILKKYTEIAPDEKITGRVIKHTVNRDGYRPLVLYFFTNSTEPAEELVELYLQRERIENDIRSLKYLMGLEILSAKSPNVLAKELLLTFAASNLMRSILSIAASALGLLPRQISFSRAARLTQVYGNKIRNSDSEKERQNFLDSFLEALKQVKHPNRKKHRVEPRLCVRHRDQFPRMQNPRSEEKLKSIELNKKFGHRGIVYSWEKRAQ